MHDDEQFVAMLLNEGKSLVRRDTIYFSALYVSITTYPLLLQFWDLVLKWESEKYDREEEKI